MPGKSLNKQYLLSFILGVIFCLPALAGEQCGGAFKADLRWRDTAIERTQHLSPNLTNDLHAATSIFDAILVLKRFEYYYSDDYTMVGRGSHVLSAPEIQELADRSRSAFDLSSANSEEATQFVANGARQVYLWLVDRLRIDLIAEQIAPAKAQGDSLRVLEILFKKSVGLDWSDRNTTPEEMEQSFADAKWKTIAWSDALNYLNGQDIENAMLKREIDEAKDRFKFRENPICCMTEQGCRTCPLNRRFRNR